MNLVSSKCSRIFLTKNTKIDKSKKVDIILSPEFYWVRVFEIPVKSINQARQVLPTLFEDIIEDIKDISYQILKIEDTKFLCFAYDNKKILSSIKNSGINISLVNSIYFAQNECKSLNKFSADNSSFYYTEDKVLVKVPNHFLQDAVDINESLQDIVLSSNKVDIKLYNNLISSKQLFFIIFISILFLVVNLFKIYDYDTSIKTLETKIKKIKSASNMPKSMLRIDSILGTYKKDVKKEIVKRDVIEYVFKNSKLGLKRVDLSKNILLLNFENTNKKEVEKYLSKRYKILYSTTKDRDLNIRIKL